MFENLYYLRDVWRHLLTRAIHSQITREREIRLKDWRKDVGWLRCYPECFANVQCMHNLELGYKGLSIFSRSHFLSSYIIYAPLPPSYSTFSIIVLLFSYSLPRPISAPISPRSITREGVKGGGEGIYDSCVHSSCRNVFDLIR